MLVVPGGKKNVGLVLIDTKKSSHLTLGKGILSRK